MFFWEEEEYLSFPTQALVLAPNPWPQPQLVFDVPGPNLYLPAPVCNFYLPAPGPQFVFTGPS